MLQPTTPALYQCVADPKDPESGATTADEALLAQLLITMWAVRTGRTLRSAPISSLTAAEIEDFWADDALMDDGLPGV